MKYFEEIYPPIRLMIMLSAFLRPYHARHYEGGHNPEGEKSWGEEEVQK
jgi:hypothetical protein